MIFTHDSFVGPTKISEYSQMLVDYCCEMHDALMKTKRVVVYCKNGRSRSPCVILAFFLLRGMSRDHAVEYLTLAFQTQRPTIYGRSVNFRKTYTVAFNFAVLPIFVSNTMNSSLPIYTANFDKFLNLTLSLEEDITKNARWIKERIVMRLGKGATLTFPGIDQPSLTISHILPTTAFIQRSNDSSETSSSSTHVRKSKRKRSSTTSTPVSNPNVY